MNHLFFILISTFIFFSTLYNGTLTQKTSTTSGRQRPDVNCTGILVDKAGGHYNSIENITIAGLYKQIRVYPKPSNSQQNPTKHRAYLDSAELLKIRVLDTIFYDKQPFTELEITRKDGAKNNYLIESNRVVRYDIPIANGYEEREINIDAVGTLTFHDCTKRIEEENKNKKRDKRKE